jgi:hypothetical protein
LSHDRRGQPLPISCRVLLILGHPSRHVRSDGALGAAEQVKTQRVLDSERSRGLVRDRPKGIGPCVRGEQVNRWDSRQAAALTSRPGDFNAR